MIGKIISNTTLINICRLQKIITKVKTSNIKIEIEGFAILQNMVMPSEIWETGLAVK